MALSALDRLRLFLRPPGKGIHTVSAGGGYAAPLLWSLYGTDSPSQIQSAWEDSLQRIRRVGMIILGVPSDTGDGILRGANFGPLGVREAYIQQFDRYPKSAVDVGDVHCVPQLLHDEMLSLHQMAATRRELYPGKAEPLPVSPLSVAEEVLMAIYELNPEAQILILGGDGSVSWPAMLYCHRRCGEDFGVLHIDSHTNLLEQRLGVRYCSTTWAHHALKLMKPQHFVQVGIRASSKPKEYWMERYPIQQFWENEIPGHESEIIAKVIQNFTDRGIRRLYISNDIGATNLSSDAPFSPSVGSPEPGGLKPEFVKQLINQVRQEFTVIGGDIVEVAPSLKGRRGFASEPTCALGAEYLQELFTSLTP